MTGVDVLCIAGFAGVVSYLTGRYANYEELQAKQSQSFQDGFNLGEKEGLSRSSADNVTMQKEFFRKGWRACERHFEEQAEEEAYASYTEEQHELADILRIDVSSEPEVWKKARKQFMLANHPDKNPWADAELVMKVNSLFDIVFK